MKTCRGRLAVPTFSGIGDRTYWVMTRSLLLCSRLATATNTKAASIRDGKVQTLKNSWILFAGRRFIVYVDMKKRTGV